MHNVTGDLRVTRLRPLIAPAVLVEEVPATEAATRTVLRAREEVAAIVSGDDERLLCVVGPCSIHDVGAAREYARKLAEAAERLSDDLLIVMRVYFEKPRTTVGWKGLINDPEIAGTFQINRGLRIARELLLALAEAGVPAGCEFLDTITPQYFADLVSWGAIGARTTESQVHRELASGLSMPIGFKNGTHGGVKIAIDAIRAASHPHHFLGVTQQGVAAIVATKGNPYCHVILRGSSAGPNHDEASVGVVAARLEAAGLASCVMVDCSHGNSGKDHERQPGVTREVAAQIAGGSHKVCGVMLESHLVAGRQTHTPDAALVYGQSITDACMAWDQTEELLRELAVAVRSRRSAR